MTVRSQHQPRRHRALQSIFSSSHRRQADQFQYHTCPRLFNTMTFLSSSLANGRHAAYATSKKKRTKKYIAWQCVWGMDSFHEPIPFTFFAWTTVTAAFSVQPRRLHTPLCRQPSVIPLPNQSSFCNPTRPDVFFASLTLSLAIRHRPCWHKHSNP